MTSITKKLREYATVAWEPWSAARDRLYQMCDTIDAVHSQLERELSEHYIALPLDMDGKPIHFGDIMQMDGDSELYDVVGFYDLGFLGWRNGRFVPCAAGLYRHHEPDTWERIIYDAMQAGRTEETVDVTPLIERCKKLAEKEMS